jgi:hypothetical protein
MEAILDGVVTHNSESTNQRSCQLKFLTLLAVNFNVNFFSQNKHNRHKSTKRKSSLKNMEEMLNYSAAVNFF